LKAYLIFFKTPFQSTPSRRIYPQISAIFKNRRKDPGQTVETTTAEVEAEEEEARQVADADAAADEAKVVQEEAKLEAKALY
jgi:hypothetical protein